MSSEPIHKSVLVEEVLDALHIQSLEKGKFIDATLGFGGHTIEILRHGHSVLGFDDDPSMLELATARIKKELGENISFQGINENFINIEKSAIENNYNKVDGILFDLGISNIHYSHSSRGFSFSKSQEDLDMRENTQTQGVKASDFLNSLRQDQLMKLFLVGMDFHEAKRLTKAVLIYRESKQIQKVGDLLEIITLSGLVNKSTNAATKAFLALRIAVNSELENIKIALPKAFNLLKTGGRMAVITFHSGEDVIVKDIFKELEGEGNALIITKKPISPSEKEIESNKSSRSSKLRVIERI